MVVSVAVVLAWFFMSKNAIVIEDTNGAADTSLAVLTDEDIVNMGAGTIVKEPQTKERKGSLFGLNFTSGTEFYSDDFSGVTMLNQWDFMLNGSIYFDLYDFEVTGGNFRMCIVYEKEEIVADIQPGELVEVRMNDLKNGKYSVVIAGESAAFSLA